MGATATPLRGSSAAPLQSALSTDGRGVSFLVGFAEWTDGVRSLLNHIKRFTVSSTGALQWMRDATEYQTCLQRLENPQVDEEMERVRDIANLFLVEPSSLSDSVRASSLCDMRADELMEFVRMRSAFSLCGALPHTILPTTD